MTITKMDELTDRARSLSQARGHLLALMQALNAGIEALKSDQMPEIRAAIEAASSAWAALEQDIRARPDLFVKPRTVAAHGITFGIEKGKGSIDIVDADKTIALIRKHLPHMEDALIGSKEFPVKKAIAQLSAADCRRIGVSVIDGVDQVVIRPAPSDVDRLVRALVRSEVEES